MLTLCGSCKKQRFGGTLRLHHQGDKTRATLCISSQRASATSYGYVPSSPILVTLMMEALRPSETSVRATRRNIPEDAILHSHRRENLKSFTVYLQAAFLSKL
jgi:hypothetical protein